MRNACPINDAGPILAGILRSAAALATLALAPLLCALAPPLAPWRVAAAETAAADPPAHGTHWIPLRPLSAARPDARPDGLITPAEILAGAYPAAWSGVTGSLAAAGGSAERLLDRLDWHLLSATPWRSTPCGDVQQMEASLDGVPVMGVRVTLHRTLDRRLDWMVLPAGLLDACAHAVPPVEDLWKVPSETLLEQARRYGVARTGDRSDPAAERRWVWGPAGLHPVYWIEPESAGRSPDPAERARILLLDAASGAYVGERTAALYANGALVAERTAALYASGATGTGLVFDPNPIVASGGLPLSSQDDIDPFRVWVSLHDLDASGFLRGRHADIESRAGRAFAPDLRYAYSSENLHFEEVMAYYHISEALRHLEALGYAAPLPEAQSVIVHATGLDASWYGLASRTIHLGDGGHEDGEDADVILHELGHAIFHAQVGAWGAGESDALSEGWADYFAASRTGGTCIGDWDAAGRPSGCLRDIGPMRRYPTDRTGNPYDDGLILSSLLWHLRENLGPDKTDRLAMQTLLLLSPIATVPDAAAALAAAARQLSQACDDRELVAVVDDALATWGFAPRTAELSLDPRIPGAHGALRLDFEFAPVGAPGALACDSLSVRPDGAIHLVAAPEAGRAGEAAVSPISAPLLALGAGGAALPYDELRVSQAGSLWESQLDLRFRSGGLTLRHARLTLFADGAIEFAWFGVGDQERFPALAGYFPGATTAGAAQFDPRADREALPSMGQGLRFVLESESGFPLAGARVRCEPAGPAVYRVVRLAAPWPVIESPRTELRIYPTPARLGSQAQLRIASAGEYELQLMSVSGRLVSKRTLGRLEPGLHPVPLTALALEPGLLPTGVFYLRLIGPEPCPVLKLLLYR